MKTFQTALLCLSVAGLSAVGLFAGSAIAGDDAPSISPEALHARMTGGSSPVILDVRSADEFEAGHIPGALNIPHTDLAGRLSELDPEAEVAVYCMMGPRARHGEKTLSEAGHQRLFHLEGGFAEWQKEGLPVATGPASAAADAALE